MGSMEQIFPIFNDDKIAGWGAMAGCSKIDGLSEIPLDVIQSAWNKMHAKYQSFQCQILTNKNLREYDDLYIGCLPPQVSRYYQRQDINELLIKEMNHRFLLLNDFNLTSDDIKNGKYKIKDIPPLYRVFICDDWMFINFNHAIIDGISHAFMSADIMSLLNGDKFDDTMVPYVNIEECIDPKYASSAISRKISNLIPTNWMFKFGKFYCNNSFLSKYNPLGMHRDDILRFQFQYSDKILSFPLKPYDHRDYRISLKVFQISKYNSLSFRKQCKLHKVHMSSVIQYLINAAMIECHSDILTADYYKTMIHNVFSTIPMYKKPLQKVYLGIHANSYMSVVEYIKNMKIGSDAFWKKIAEIDEQVLNDAMVAKVYKNKFPYLNIKKIMNEILSYDYDIFDGRAMGPPTVSNPGRANINKQHWRYKIVASKGGANPGVGMGAPYILAGHMIKGVDELNMYFVYGIQHLSEDMAQKVVDKLKQKMQIIASTRINYQSKL